MKLYTFIRNNFLTFIFTLFLVCLVLFSNSNLQATKNGILLWAENVVPSLFPFFIATELLNYTNLPYYFGKLTNKFMRPLFNVPGEASYAFIMGIISGYPVGAKIVNKFLDDGICTKNEAERMLAFTNNSGPLFIIGTIGISLFGYNKIGFLLFVTHILSCITVGILFGLLSKNIHVTIRTIQIYKEEKNCNISNLGNIISTSITSAISTILLVGGYIVLFSTIISILNSLNIINCISLLFNNFGVNSEYVKGIFIGLIEITHGITFISSLHTKRLSISIIVTSFLLGFAGLSIFLQIFSIASKNKLSMKFYLIGKLLQGCFAALYTFIFLNCFNILNLDIL